MTAISDKTKPLPTIWRVPDDLWEVFHHLILTHDPPKTTGRKRIDPRKAFDGIIFRLRTGCQWNQLPKELGDDSSVHRTFQRWDALGLFDTLWATMLTYCRELDAVDWSWQAADANLCKARGVPKRGQSTNVWATTPQIVVSRASRKACLSKPMEARSASRLAGPTLRTRTCSR